MKEFHKLIMKDLSVELADEFDRNFERKAFFDKPWPPRKSGKRGSLLLVKGGGGLRGSILMRQNVNTVIFSSSLPYAAIHNEGGTITVTGRMKKFFWAKYYELSGKVKVNARDRKISKRSMVYSEEAEYYKSLALMRVGSKITIPERRFIGWGKPVDDVVKRVSDRNFKELAKDFKIVLKNI